MMQLNSTEEKVGGNVIGIQGGNRRRVPVWRVVALAVIIATGASAERVDPASIRVIDGDTVELDGQSIRLVGFDTPKTWEPECDYERVLDALATDRLVELVGSGMGVDVTMLLGRDRYDRGLARMFIGNIDVSDILTAEGLARPYERGRRAEWCG